MGWEADIAVKEGRRCEMRGDSLSKKRNSGLLGTWGFCRLGKIRPTVQSRILYEVGDKLHAKLFHCPSSIFLCTSNSIEVHTG